MKLKWIVLAVALIVCVAGWLGFGAVMVLGLSQAIKIGAFTGALLATEAVIWAGAFVLGVSIFEARRRIWRGLTGPFRREQA